MPERWISRVVASAFDERTVYAAQNGKRWDDFGAYLWKSTDYGATWKSIAGNIPCGPINVIREDPANPKILYVGTDMGVFVSTDGGESWSVLGGNLPSTFVHDLIIHPRDRMIVIATHGRGVWVMDAAPLAGRRQSPALRLRLWALGGSRLGRRDAPPESREPRAESRRRPASRAAGRSRREPPRAESRRSRMMEPWRTR